MEQIQPGQPHESQPVDTPVGQKLPKFNLTGKKNLMIGGGVVILLGVVTGWVLSSQGVGRNILGLGGAVPGAVSGPDEAGLSDESTFKDSAEGIIEDGGVNGEGTHHLVREGGVSQNVYLTSTVIDLDAFVGKKVTVWGQTIGAREAGWLMDVGKVQVID